MKNAPNLAVLGTVFAMLISVVCACSHSVVGEGGTGQSTSASEGAPTVGQPCRCSSPVDTNPPDNCCAGDLSCQDLIVPGRTTCDSIGCFRKGTCVERGSSTTSSASSSGSTSTSTGTGNTSPPASTSSFPEPPPDECSPFKNPPQGTCPTGQECHLVKDHWGCV